jgi:hypothetical protein
MAFGISDSLVTKLAGNDGNLLSFLMLPLKLAEPASLRVATSGHKAALKQFTQSCLYHPWCFENAINSCGENPCLSLRGINTFEERNYPFVGGTNPLEVNPNPSVKSPGCSVKRLRSIMSVI